MNQPDVAFGARAVLVYMAPLISGEEIYLLKNFKLLIEISWEKKELSIQQKYITIKKIKLCKQKEDQ